MLGAMDKITLHSSASEVIADPHAFLRAIREAVPDFDAQAAAALADAAAEEELTGDMVNLRKKSTGVDNTVFITQKGHIRHAARIKVAIDPPDAITAKSKTASVAIHNGAVVAGEHVPPDLLRQLNRFIELNREALLDYWEERTGTEELLDRLQPVS